MILVMFWTFYTEYLSIRHLLLNDMERNEELFFVILPFINPCHAE